MNHAKKIVLANLQAFLAPKKIADWCEMLISTLGPVPDHIELVLALPDMALDQAATKVKGVSGVSLAAQAVSPFPQGGYTGSTPAQWLSGLVRYALVGHRDRRAYFHESVHDVVRQAHEALDEEIRPIVCVDSECFAQQVDAFRPQELGGLIWAFTPRVEMPLDASDFATIAAAAANMSRRNNDRPVLYGGGITYENCRDLWQIEGLAGIMLGQASHDAQAFANLIKRLAYA